MEFGLSHINGSPLNSVLANQNIFPVSNAFMTLGFGANLRERPDYSIDFVYRVSSNLNNAAFEKSTSNSSKDAIFNFQTAGLELIMFRQTVGKFKIEPMVGFNYLWASLNISDISLDTSSIQAILNNVQTTKDLSISRRMTTANIGCRLNYVFKLQERPLLVGLYPQLGSNFYGGFDSGWMTGRQVVYGLEQLNMRYFSLLGRISLTL